VRHSSPRSNGELLGADSVSKEYAVGRALADAAATLDWVDRRAALLRSWTGRRRGRIGCGIGEEA